MQHRTKWVWIDGFESENVFSHSRMSAGREFRCHGCYSIWRFTLLLARNVTPQCSSLKCEDVNKEDDIYHLMTETNVTLCLSMLSIFCCAVNYVQRHQHNTRERHIQLSNITCMIFTVTSLSQSEKYGYRQATKFSTWAIITSVCFCLFCIITSHLGFWMYVKDRLWYMNIWLLIFDTCFVMYDVLLLHGDYCTIY